MVEAHPKIKSNRNFLLKPRGVFIFFNAHEEQRGNNNNNTPFPTQTHLLVNSSPTFFSEKKIPPPPNEIILLGILELETSVFSAPPYIRVVFRQHPRWGVWGGGICVRIGLCCAVFLVTFLSETNRNLDKNDRNAEWKQNSHKSER